MKRDSLPLPKDILAYGDKLESRYTECDSKGHLQLNGDVVCGYCFRTTKPLDPELFCEGPRKGISEGQKRLDYMNGLVMLHVLDEREERSSRYNGLEFV